MALVCLTSVRLFSHDQIIDGEALRPRLTSLHWYRTVRRAIRNGKLTHASAKETILLHMNHGRSKRSVHKPFKFSMRHRRHIWHLPGEYWHWAFTRIKDMRIWVSSSSVHSAGGYIYIYIGLYMSRTRRVFRSIRPRISRSEERFAKGKAPFEKND